MTYFNSPYHCKHCGEPWGKHASQGDYCPRTDGVAGYNYEATFSPEIAPLPPDAVPAQQAESRLGRDVATGCDHPPLVSTDLLDMLQRVRPRKLATKPTNPKDAIGSGKLPMELVPDIITVEAATAMLEGALKYGRFNWRVTGVRSSIYRAALQRHLSKWWNGEDRDPKTLVRHLASVIACAGILLDAELCGKLTDDRPPAAPVSERIDEHEQLVKHLKEIFKDHAPRQYTIADSIEETAP